MVLVILATVLLLGGGAAAYIFTRSDPIDKASLCPRTGPTGVHAILVDRSDPISALQATRVKQILDRAVLDASVGTKVALFIADSDGTAGPTSVLALCNPGREANPLYQNPRMVRDQYERDFKARLDASLSGLMTASTRDSSPIMESLKAVCIEAFGAAPSSVPLRLTVVSDMIQHSAIASHYRDRDYEALLRSPRLQTLRTDCRGADVDVVYLLRPTQRGQPGVQTRAHQSFWDRYLQSLNARPRSIEPI
jgi:hypothetical protein